MPDGSVGVYLGGYPWKEGGILTAADLNAAIQIALSPVRIIQPGTITNVMLATPYLTIGTTTINLGATVQTLGGLLDPVNDLDVANKHYVDQHGGGGSGGGGIVDAPADGHFYGRVNAAWAQGIPLAGGVTVGGTLGITGMLTASGGATIAGSGLNVTGGATLDSLTITTGNLAIGGNFSAAGTLTVGSASAYGTVYLGPRQASPSSMMLAGPLTLAAGAPDNFTMACRQTTTAGAANSSYFDGPFISFRGPGIAAPNTNTISLQAGQQSTGYKQLLFDPAGNLTLPGPNSIVYGGAAANDQFTIQSTSNASPSGDQILLRSSTITLRAIAGGLTTVNIGAANSTSGALVIAGGASGAQTFRVAQAASGTITFPNGTANYSVGGGPKQVVMQETAGQVFNVRQLNTNDIAVTATNDNAPPAAIGEVISSIVTAGAAATLPSGTATDITQIVLTPGDWQVSGCVEFQPGPATNVANSRAWISTASAAPPDPGTQFLPYVINQTPTSGGAYTAISLGPGRLSISANVTLRLGAQSAWASGIGNFAFGWLLARRMR